MDPVVRMASTADIPMLERDVRGVWGGSFETDLEQQDAGLHSCFIAVVDSEILGSGFIRWAGPRDPEASRLFPAAPEIYRLAVKEERRSQGIGTLLIAAMEQDAQGKGYRSVSLGVGHENPRAYSLYKRLGFADTTLTEYYDEYFYPTPDGKTAKARDLCRYLVKNF